MILLESIHQVKYTPRRRGESDAISGNQCKFENIVSFGPTLWQSTKRPIFKRRWKLIFRPFSVTFHWVPREAKAHKALEPTTLTLIPDPPAGRSFYYWSSIHESQKKFLTYRNCESQKWPIIGDFGGSLWRRKN